MAGQSISIQQDADGAVGPAHSVAAPAHFSAFAKDAAGGLHEIEVMVGGIHCAGCIQKVENAVKADPAVRQARLNFSTKRLRIAWDGPAELADRIAGHVTAAGYDVSAYDPQKMNEDYERENRFLLLCTGVAGFAAGNIMLLSFALWSTTIETMGVGTRDFLHWISALIALPAIGFSGRPFFASAFKALKSGRANMDVPISLALLLATGMSLFRLFSHAEDAYFDSAVMLMFFLLIGRYLDFRARARARGAAGDLLALMGGTATVLHDDGSVKIMPVSALREGVVVRVAIGERIPADGVIISGQSALDLSLITGESLPSATGEGDEVYSGAVNVAAPLKIRIEKKAGESFLADIVRLMEKAEQAQSGYVRLADRVARLYTPVVHTLAAASFIGWFFVGGMAWDDALLIAVTVLIITCPCALGLAVPVVQVLAVGRLMKQGVMVKAGDALERLAAADTVLLDKTGTLTIGHPALCNAQDIAPEDLKRAASLAAHSRHPLSRAIVRAYDGAVDDISVEEKPGQGLQGKGVRLGNRTWCGPRGAVEDSAAHLELWLAVDGRASVRFLFEDPLRADAKDTLDGLRKRGMNIVLLSGDRESAVAHAAQALGIEDYHGAVKPEDKLQILEACRAAGAKILMIGDGLNDAPVLAAADVSVSPSSAIDIAQNAADIVFTGDLLQPVLAARDVAVRAQRLVKQNFMLSALYNVIAVPLAVAGHVTPLVAAIAMSSSSLIVILNSFRLTRKQ